MRVSTIPHCTSATYLVQKQGEPPKPVVILDADHRAKPLDDPCEHC